MPSCRLGESSLSAERVSAAFLCSSCDARSLEERDDLCKTAYALSGTFFNVSGGMVATWRSALCDDDACDPAAAAGGCTENILRGRVLNGAARDLLEEGPIFEENAGETIDAAAVG
jgi:hypothetical protein